MYKIDSPHAEEFINHDEIMATLDYAKANKDNRELIRSIIDKARDCKGLLIVKPPFCWNVTTMICWKKYMHWHARSNSAFTVTVLLCCSALFVKLLCKQLRILSLPHQKQVDCPQEAYSG